MPKIRKSLAIHIKLRPLLCQWTSIVWLIIWRAYRVHSCIKSVNGFSPLTPQFSDSDSDPVERNLTGYQQLDFSTPTHMRKFHLTIYDSKRTCYRTQVVVNEAGIVSHFTVDLFSPIFFFHCCLPVFIIFFLFIFMFSNIKWYKFLISSY